MSVLKIHHKANLNYLALHSILAAVFLFAIVLIATADRVTALSEATLAQAEVVTANPSCSNGAVNHFTRTDFASVQAEAVMTPTQPADGFHFYSLNVGLIDNPINRHREGGLYAGIQTNGYINGGWVGKIFIFSVWDAQKAHPTSEASSTVFTGEGTGYSLRQAFSWQPDRSYRVVVRRTSFDENAEAYRWRATITDLVTNQTLNVGEILGPKGRNYMYDVTLFHERYGGERTCCSEVGPLDKAGVKFSAVRARPDKEDNSLKALIFDQSLPNGIFANEACGDYIDYSSSSAQAKSNFGIRKDSPPPVEPPTETQTQVTTISPPETDSQPTPIAGATEIVVESDSEEEEETANQADGNKEETPKDNSEAEDSPAINNDKLNVQEFKPNFTVILLTVILSIALLLSIIIISRRRD